MSTYKVQLRVSYINVEIDIDTTVYAQTPMHALGKFLRDCQQIPKALDAVDPKGAQGESLMANHRKMKLTVDIESQQEPGHVHRAGATGIVVEPLGANAWLVEVRVPDPTLEGDAWYETLEVKGDEFELIDRQVS